MKKSLKMVLIMIASLTVFAMTSKAQEQKPSLSADDIAKIRRINADKEYFKQKYEEEKRAHAETAKDRDKWQQSSEEWKATAAKEKTRADVTQGNRIKELESANNELGRANFELRQQSADDKQKIGEQNFEISKLKSGRKWYFLAGFATGFATGGYTGYQIGKRYGVTFRF